MFKFESLLKLPDFPKNPTRGHIGLAVVAGLTILGAILGGLALVLWRPDAKPPAPPPIAKPELPPTTFNESEAKEQAIRRFTRGLARAVVHDPVRDETLVSFTSTDARKGMRVPWDFSQRNKSYEESLQAAFLYAEEVTAACTVGTFRAPEWDRKVQKSKKRCIQSRLTKGERGVHQLAQATAARAMGGPYVPVR